MTETVKTLFEENRDETGVILEPVVGNAGFIVPDAGFLEGLRQNGMGLYWCLTK